MTKNKKHLSLYEFIKQKFPKLNEYNINVACKAVEDNPQLLRIFGLSGLYKPDKNLTVPSERTILVIDDPNDP